MHSGFHFKPIVSCNYHSGWQTALCFVCKLPLTLLAAELCWRIAAIEFCNHLICSCGQTKVVCLLYILPAHVHVRVMPPPPPHLRKCNCVHSGYANVTVSDVLAAYLFLLILQIGLAVDDIEEIKKIFLDEEAGDAGTVNRIQPCSKTFSKRPTLGANKGGLCRQVFSVRRFNTLKPCEAYNGTGGRKEKSHKDQKQRLKRERA